MNNNNFSVNPLGNDEIDKHLSIALRNFDYKTRRIDKLYEQLKISPQLDEHEKVLLEVLKLVTKRFLEIDKCLEEFKGIYYDWNGEKIHGWEWRVKRMLFSRHVGEDFINGYRISTVWLGLDFGFIPSQKPQIFETVIFKEKETEEEDKWDERYMERYFSYEEAVEGHNRACEHVKQFNKEQYEK